MSIRFFSANDKLIGTFHEDRLVFEKGTEYWGVVVNLVDEGMEVPVQFQEKLHCTKWVKYPKENADPKEVELFKEVFLKYYFPYRLASKGYKLEGVVYEHKRKSN